MITLIRRLEITSFIPPDFRRYIRNQYGVIYCPGGFAYCFRRTSCSVAE